MHQLPTAALLIDDVPVVPVSSVREFGIFADADLVMRSTIGFAVCCCTPPVRSNPSAAATNGHVSIAIVVALVNCRLDYDNNLLVGILADLVC